MPLSPSLWRSRARRGSRDQGLRRRASARALRAGGPPRPANRSRTGGELSSSMSRGRAGRLSVSFGRTQETPVKTGGHRRTPWHWIGAVQPGRVLFAARSGRWSMRHNLCHGELSAATSGGDALDKHVDALLTHHGWDVRILREQMAADELEWSDPLFPGQYGDVLAGSVYRRACARARAAVHPAGKYRSPVGKRVYDLRHTCLSRGSLASLRRRWRSGRATASQCCWPPIRGASSVRRSYWSSAWRPPRSSPRRPCLH